MTKSHQRQPRNNRNKTIINGDTYLGANGRVTLANIIDAGGVGVDYAECLWMMAHKHHSQHTFPSLTTPTRINGSHHIIHLNCRIVDQVGNIGNNTTISGFVDLQTPTTTILPMAGNTITANSTISFATTDANLNGTSTATITWTNATSSWNTTVHLQRTWTGSIAGLNSNLGDGSVSISVVTQMVWKSTD